MSVEQFACFNFSQDTVTPLKWFVDLPLRPATLTMAAFDSVHGDRDPVESLVDCSHHKEASV